MRTASCHLAFRAFCVAGVTLALTGCGKRSAPNAGGAASGPPPLARVNDRELTEADFRFEVQRRLDAGKPAASPEAVLNDLVEREVMLQEARKSDWINDPAVRRDLENQLLTRWLEHTLQRKKDQVSVTDEELRQAYDSHLDNYTKPALVRLAMLFRKRSPNDSEETRASLKAELEKGRAAFLKDRDAARQGDRMTGFGSIAAMYSEDAVSRFRGGDLGWLDPSLAGHRVPADVMAAGVALAVGEVSPVLTADDGFYIVMKTDARPPQVTSFESVVESLRRRMLKQRQEEVAQNFTRGLLAGNRIDINKEKISQLTLPQVSSTAVEKRIPGLLPTSEFNATVADPRP